MSALIMNISEALLFVNVFDNWAAGLDFENLIERERRGSCESVTNLCTLVAD